MNDAAPWNHVIIPPLAACFPPRAAFEWNYQCIFFPKLPVYCGDWTDRNCEDWEESSCLVDWSILDESNYSFHQWPLYFFYWFPIICSVCTRNICSTASAHWNGVLICVHDWYRCRRKWSWGTISTARGGWAWTGTWRRKGGRHDGLILTVA